LLISAGRLDLFREKDLEVSIARHDDRRTESRLESERKEKGKRVR
jgi:hypothetical protein